MPKQLTWEELRVKRWIEDHPGVLTLIAAKLMVTPQYVQQVAWGKSTSRPGNRIEQALRGKGWPGIRRSR